MATYVNDLRLKEIGTGESSGTWGTETNVNLELIGEALSFGTEAITTNADTHTSTVADGSTDPARSMYIKYTGTLDSACTITIAPNTVSRLHFIENATSGSQNIIISQGSGANVTIPAGDVKVVYLDGAGSGAAVVDAFASLNVVDLKVEDDLTVTDDATIGGTLGVTGVLTANAGVVVDNITIDGTEIDLSSGDLLIDSAGKIQLSADTAGDIELFDGTLHYATLSEDNSNFLIQSIIQDEDILFKGDDGGSVITALTLDMSDAGTAIFNSYAKFSDNQRIVMGAGTDLSIYSDGTDGNIDGAAKIKLDAVDEIHLDSDSGIIRIQDDAGDVGMFQMTSSDFIIRSMTSDKDLIFKGNDGGSVITALTLDMSEAGAATFGDPSYGSGLGQVRIINNANSIAPASLSLFGFGNVADDAEYAKIDAAMQLSGTAGQVAASISFQADGTGENKSHIDFLTHTSSALTQAMRITSAQRVGIGPTAPDSLLHVDGSLSGGPVCTIHQTAGASSSDRGLEVETSSTGTTVQTWKNSGSELARVNGSGLLGIGETSLDAILTVSGESSGGFNSLFTQGSAAYQNFTLFFDDSRGNGTANFRPATLPGSGTANMGFRFTTITDGSGTTNANLIVDGSFTKGSGSFMIDHPLESMSETHHLYHSFIEGPQADNIYRGKVQLVDGKAVVNIDEVSSMTEGTFCSLNRDTQCFTTNESDWDAVKGSIQENILTIECQNTSSTATISWIVVGERCDKHMYDTDWTDENGKVVPERVKPKNYNSGPTVKQQDIVH
jgi:hypothetical protein